MGKFRTKLKRNSKGKVWQKGSSSTTNPENMKYRNKARSRFFQPNLNQTQEDNLAANSLTVDKLQKHDARLSYASNKKNPTINDIAGSLKSFSIDSDAQSESQLDFGGTFKTFQTFASNYSNCTNVSFKKLLNGFRSTSEQHKEMLAILTALTDIIKQRGGTESSTEYFLLLMETIEANNLSNDSEIMACITLLGMGIKTVPVPVLRKKFSDSTKILLSLLENFINSENQSIIKYIIGCISVLLRAQDYTTWSYSSTLQCFDAILTFTTHSRPKIRKCAQHAIVSIIHGSSFMLLSKSIENCDEKLDESKQTKYHPASSKVAKFCLSQFTPENLVNAQTNILHTLCLLKDTISGFKTEDIRSICESLLSIMTAPNVMLRTNCLQTLHSLFLSRTTNLNGDLCGKLISAIYEYQPDKTDVRQTLVWLTVMKQAHIHLFQTDKNICMRCLPNFIDVCATDLWMSNRSEIIGGVSNAIKEILYDCIALICKTKSLANEYENSIKKCIDSLGKVLSAPFGDVAKLVILTFAIVFEVTGEYFTQKLLPYLKTLGDRYEPESSLCIHIEHAIISAIKSMEPKHVLKAIPLTNAQNEILLEKSWLLPLLREGIQKSTFEYFSSFILVQALNCNKKWQNYIAEKNTSMAHTYELLCCQLWGLFPGFCRNPKDPENFKLIAKTVGIALVENVEFRAPILDGLIEMILNPNETVQLELAKYSKNYLPRLFNIYTMKPNGTYEADLRKKTLETIKLFLTVTNENIINELFATAKEQLSSTTAGTFESDSILDIIFSLSLHQNATLLKPFYEEFIVSILKGDKRKFIPNSDLQKMKKIQRKTYEFLTEILLSDKKNCEQFTKKNASSIEKLLYDTLKSSNPSYQAFRLKCLKILIQRRNNITIKDKLVINTIPEAIVTYKELSTKKENISQEILIIIANMFKEADQLNDFVDIIMAGLGGDQKLITNTILALRSIVQNLSGNLTVNTLEFILQQILVFIVQRQRSEVEAGVAFIITFIKVFPSPLVANHLQSIMRSLSAMVPDTKRYCRIQVGYLLKKLCKRFSAEELIKFVPGDDELTHRRLKKIRKQLRREARKADKEEEKDSDDSDNEELITGLEKKSITIDDVLADSDSDLTDDDNDEDTKKSKSLKSKSNKKISQKTYIQEMPEEIVDLADIKSVGNVLTNKPNLNETKSMKNKSKDINRGFKTADDGRLIITDKYMKDDSSSDEENVLDTSFNLKDNKRKRGMEDDSSDEEPKPPISRKRKAVDSVSQISGKTGNSKYTSGGKGIHRSLTAESVKSGVSKMSKATTKSVGNMYSSKKAKGDMKKKGKPDPFAYIPLSRNVLNKRKKSTSQFKSVVRNSRKKMKTKK